MQFPLTGHVLGWAIDQSGRTTDEVAAHVGVSPNVLREWIDERSLPNKGQVEKIASLLKRELAFFLLPVPPSDEAPEIAFRAPKAGRTQLNPAEILAHREAVRLQEVTAWVRHELKEDLPTTPKFSIRANPEAAAAKIRTWLKLDGFDPAAENLSAAKAMRIWRSAAEQQGILVLALPIGRDSLRGFSLWKSAAPLIAYNTTGWRVEARAYTLFHELGHLATRTQSACTAHVPTFGPHDDEVERWCEAFAAAVLMPWNRCEAFLVKKLRWSPGMTVNSLEVARKVANHFRVSLSAAVIRLIDHDVATWDLFRSIPKSSDANDGGGGGGGRDRLQIRLDEYGEATVDLFRRAHRRGVVSTGDVISYLRLDVDDLNHQDGEAA